MFAENWSKRPAACRHERCGRGDWVHRVNGDHMSETVAYIQSLELPAPRSRGPAEPAPPPPAFTAGPQGFAIGSQLTEFTPQVAASVRPAVSNSLLLAQLASDKANPGA